MGKEYNDEQKLKKLLDNWKNRSKSLKKGFHTEGGNATDLCISELENIINTDKNGGLKQKP